MPPITSGLVGYYHAGSFNATNNRWNDDSGAGNHATITRGTTATTGTETRAGSTISYVYGAQTDGIRFPQNFNSSNLYTLFHVTR